MKSTIDDEKLKDNITGDEGKSILSKCDEAVNWLDGNQQAEKEKIIEQTEAASEKAIKKCLVSAIKDITAALTTGKDNISYAVPVGQHEVSSSMDAGHDKMSAVIVLRQDKVYPALENNSRSLDNIAGVGEHVEEINRTSIDSLEAGLTASITKGHMKASSLIDGRHTKLSDLFHKTNDTLGIIASHISKIGFDNKETSIDIAWDSLDHIEEAVNTQGHKLDTGISALISKAALPENFWNNVKNWDTNAGEALNKLVGCVPQGLEDLGTSLKDVHIQVTSGGGAIEAGQSSVTAKIEMRHG